MDVPAGCFRDAGVVIAVDTEEVLEDNLIETGFTGFVLVIGLVIDFVLATDFDFATIFDFTATFAFAVLDFAFTFDLTAIITS